MKPNTKAVIKYLQSLGNKDVTAADVAEALDLPKKSVDGVFTMAIQKKDLGFRQEAEIEVEEGKHKTVKFLKLNDAGMALDVDAEDNN
jgi:hypothetical protein